jgi:hypothetical protein
MGCEPGGFGWSATVEVCSARVTRLVTGLENFEKFPARHPVPGSASARHPVPGTGCRDEICQHSDPGDRKGAWHLGEDEICQHSDWGIAKVPGTGCGDEICQHSD